MSEPLNALLIRHEGLKLKPYTDTVGKLTIGVGRNLTDMGLTQDEVLLLLQNDIERCRCELNKALPWWVKLGEVREAVMLSLCFNLGMSKLLSFKPTLGLIENGQYAMDVHFPTQNWEKMELRISSATFVPMIAPRWWRCWVKMRAPNAHRAP